MVVISMGLKVIPQNLNCLNEMVRYSMSGVITLYLVNSVMLNEHIKSKHTGARFACDYSD